MKERERETDPLADSDLFDDLEKTLQEGDFASLLTKTPNLDETEISDLPADLKNRSFRRQTGRYQVLECLGCGGMAEVYLAERKGARGFTRKVVIKKILANLSDKEVAVQRFIYEARLAAKFHHSNIVDILDLGIGETGYFMVMEYVKGKNVRDILRRLQTLKRRCPIPVAAAIAAGVAQALHYAHTYRDDNDKAHVIVHRDVTPENIMVAYEGAIKLLDFGVAKEALRPVRSTRLVGKPPYLAPETILGDGHTPASDIYGLGTLLFEILAGTVPFPIPNDGTTSALLMQIVETDAPSLVDIDERVSVAVDSIVAKALAKKPEHRYATAADLVDDLVFSVPIASAEEVGRFVSALFEEQQPPVFDDDTTDTHLRAPQIQRALESQEIELTPPPERATGHTLVGVLIFAVAALVVVLGVFWLFTVVL
ncbi:serine/threonine-protein kinase [Myxococcota bacterium]